jgi:hypothetical protein
MKNILDLHHTEFKDYLLKQDSYSNIELPPYFEFEKLLNELDKLLKRKKLDDLKIEVPSPTLTKPNKKRKLQPSELENVNYQLLHNKNGKYDWRPLELLNPILYVNLINHISEESNWNTILRRFKYIDIVTNQCIECLSLPVVNTKNEFNKSSQILEWWMNVEQKSIELGLEFEYLYHTDISNCYGSIYTHSIPWAIHGRKTAKKHRDDDSFIGNRIDIEIRNMRYGQTNGIPQGSVLMDIIAEIVLKYVDLLLFNKLTEDKSFNQSDYKILRYRDDYRMFCNRPDIGETILKYLSEVLIDLGMKLNPYKTYKSSNVIQNSVKEEKISWLSFNQTKASLQQRLLLLHKFSLEKPNNSILNKELEKIYKDIKSETTNVYTLKDYNPRRDSFIQNQNIKVLLSIVVDIAYHNTNSYPKVCAIISQLIQLVDKDEQRDLIIKMMKKFISIPNTGHMQIWLQRAIRQFQGWFETSLHEFSDNLCLLSEGQNVEIWNNEWLKDEAKDVFINNPIISKEIRDNLPFTIDLSELLSLSNEQSL